MYSMWQRANSTSSGQTHMRLTHNRKRAGGDNGAESPIASDFPKQKGPQSTEKWYSEGWKSVGKDEVSSSNLDRSYNILAHKLSGFGAFYFDFSTF